MARSWETRENKHYLLCCSQGTDGSLPLPSIGVKVVISNNYNLNQRTNVVSGSSVAKLNREVPTTAALPPLNCSQFPHLKNSRNLVFISTSFVFVRWTEPLFIIPFRKLQHPFVTVNCFILPSQNDRYI